MSAFRKIGPAIGALSAAISPAGGGGSGAQLGDVRLFPPDIDPGAGWLRAGSSISYTQKLDLILQMRWSGPLNIPSTGNVRTMTSNGTSLVAGGSGGELWSSPTGITWTQRSNPFASSATPVNGLTFGAGLFVAVGGAGRIATSPDGVAWTNRASGLATSTTLNAVCFANGQFVAVGTNGSAVTSPDGVTWTSRGGTGGQMADVIFGSGQFVAVGANGRVVTSPDGIAWTARAYPHSSSIVAICFGNGQFIAVGGTSIGLSQDGIIWNGAALPPGSGAMSDVHFGTELYFTAGANGQVYSSRDGFLWERRTFVSTAQINCLASQASQVLAGMNNAQISFVNDRLLRGPEVDAKPVGKFDWNAYTRIAP